MEARTNDSNRSVCCAAVTPSPLHAATTPAVPLLSLASAAPISAWTLSSAACIRSMISPSVVFSGKASLEAGDGCARRACAVDSCGHPTHPNHLSAWTQSSHPHFVGWYPKHRRRGQLVHGTVHTGNPCILPDSCCKTHTHAPIGTQWFTITGTHTFTTSGTRTLTSQHQLHRTL